MHSMVSMNQSVFLNLVTAVEPCDDVECCGFFFGQENANHRMITKVMPVNNSAKDKRAQFEIASGDYLNAERLASKENMQLLGVYHSHPNHPAVPSEYDKKAAQPYFSYIILSVMKKKVEDVRSWRLDGDSELKEEEIEITKIIN